MTVHPATANAGREDGGPGVTVEPRQFPVNRGRLCQKGWTAGSLIGSPDRLTAPLVRSAGVLRPAGWNEALDLVATRLTDLRAAHGPDAVAVFGGGGLTNEKAYRLGNFARVALGTSQVDYNGRFCMSSAAAAGIRAFGRSRPRWSSSRACRTPPCSCWRRWPVSAAGTSHPRWRTSTPSTPSASRDGRWA
jgi:anaerobic selenocysteine-containing dehydrogenase